MLTGLLLALVLVFGWPADDVRARDLTGLLSERQSCSQKRECTPRGSARPFAPSSFWNQQIAPEARIEPRSKRYVGHLLRTIDEHGTWMNTTKWSTPVYTVGAGHPTQRVVVDQPLWAQRALREAFAQVPIPDDARPAPDSDGHLVIWQPSTDTMWEMWRARKDIDGWHMQFGGRIDNVSKSSGIFPKSPGWGSTATGLSVLGGLVRISELQAGRINHALALGLPGPARGRVVWPAQRGDGDSDHPDAIPEGTRLRIDPDVDLDKLNMPTFTRILAEAAQRYGIVVVDRAGSVAFAGEDPAPYGSNPYWPSPNGFFGGKLPDQLLKSFPWSKLEVVKPD
jgi:hypothetical protein